MKIGDILVCLDNTEYIQGHYKPYTKGKHYTIYKIDDSFIPNCICGYIMDDYGDSVYFKENEAEDKEWKYLKTIRKQKLEKLNYNGKF